MLQRLRANLQLQIVIGIVLGVFAGLFLGELAVVLHPIGNAFILLLKMSVLPLMAAALIHAIGRLNAQQAARVLLYTLFSLLTVWGITIATIYTVTLVFPGKPNPSFFSNLTTAAESQTDIIQLFIPDNPIRAFANDQVPGVVFFSLLFGLALMGARKKEALLDTLHLVVVSLTRIMDWITRLTPLGAFALIAETTGSMSVTEFAKIRLYFFAYVIGIIGLVMLALPLVIAALTPLRAGRFLTAMRPAMLLGFTTGNAIITLPLIVQALMVLGEECALDADDVENTSESVVPIAYNFPTIGNIFTLLFMLFMSFFYAIPMEWTDHFRLFVLGLPVLFGSGNTTLNAVSFLLPELGLPSDGVALFVETMPLVRNFQILGSVTGIASVGCLTMFAYCGALSISVPRLLRSVGVTALGFTLVVFLTRFSLGSVAEDQPVFGELSIREPVTSRLLSDESVRLLPLDEDVLLDIAKTGRLRVGYAADAAPFSYFNDRGELVGYDIAMAHDLARALDAEIDFIPLDYGLLPKQLRERRFDIAMGATSLTEERLRDIKFSDIYETVQYVLVVEDFRRDQFASYARLKERSDLSIAVLAGSSSEVLLQHKFPNADVVAVQNIDEFLRPGLADALFVAQSEGTVWSLIHPRYTVVTTDQAIGFEHYAYALPPQDERFQDFVNGWLDIKKLDQFTQAQYAYWVDGKEDETEPRWSIIRDVLNWVD